MRPSISTLGVIGMVMCLLPIRIAAVERLMPWREKTSNE
jgi:hypothetical protein